jgi:hypothetical protein
MVRAGRGRVWLAGGVVAAVVAAGTVAVALSATTTGRLSPPTTRAGNLAAARADAAALLARLRLPRGTRRSPVEPPGDDGLLAGAQAPDGPFVDDRAWWTIAAAPRSVLAFVDAHLPAGSRGGETSQPAALTATAVPSGAWSAEFSWPAITGVLGRRVVEVSIVALRGGGSGVRADAQVSWLSPRPPAERIPANAVRLVVAVGRVSGGRAQAAVVFTSRARIRAAATALNHLPLAQFYSQFGCFSDGSRVSLTFLSRGARTPLAVATISPGACTVISLAIDGRSEPALGATPFPGSGLPAGPPARFMIALARILGMHLPSGLSP